MRTIIHHPDDMPVTLAVAYIEVVKSKGLISESAGVPQYCFVTTFNEANVVARRRKTVDSAHSFLVEWAEDRDKTKAERERRRSTYTGGKP